MSLHIIILKRLRRSPSQANLAAQPQLIIPRPPSYRIRGTDRCVCADQLRVPLATRERGTRTIGCTRVLVPKDIDEYTMHMDRVGGDCIACSIAFTRIVIDLKPTDYDHVSASSKVECTTSVEMFSSKRFISLDLAP